MGWRKALPFYGAILVFCTTLFLPLLDNDIISGFQNSIGYYFAKFEFNASIYYIVRWLGYMIFGFNIIQISGLVLGVIAFSIILFISFGSEKSPQLRLWFAANEMRPLASATPGSANESSLGRGLLLLFTIVLLIYFLFTTTLHPWYISTLLALSVFTQFRFPVLWTALIFLTYAGYGMDGFQENLWLTFLEYVFVLGYLVFELVWKRKYSLSLAS